LYKDLLREQCDWVCNTTLLWYLLLWILHASDWLLTGWYGSSAESHWACTPMIHSNNHGVFRRVAMAGNLLEKQSRTRLETTKEKDQDNTTTNVFNRNFPNEGARSSPPWRTVMCISPSRPHNIQIANTSQWQLGIMFYLKNQHGVLWVCPRLRTGGFPITKGDNAY